MRQFIKEISTAEYYRQHPGAILDLAKAKIALRRYRHEHAAELLTTHGYDWRPFLQGLTKWRTSIDQMRDAISSAGQGQGGISEADGEILYYLVRVLRPRIVIETGIAAGASSTYIGAALIDNTVGTLYSIDLNPANVSFGAMKDGSAYRWQKHGIGWAIPPKVIDELGARRKERLGDVRVVLPTLLEEIANVDLFFHDDLHTPDHMLWEYQLVWKYLTYGGVLVSDDCNAGWVEFVKKLGLGANGLRNVQNLAIARKVQA